MERATEHRPRRRPPRLRRKRLNRMVILAASVILLAILWIIYWYGASQVGAAVLDRLTAAAAARGYTAACDDISGGGFPLSVDLSCSRASLAGTGGMHATIDGFSAKTPLYRPWSIQSTATGPLTVNLQTGASDVTASWESAETTIDAGLAGLSGIATSLTDLRLDLASVSGATPIDRLILRHGEVAVFPAAGNDYRLSAAARGLVLETENGGDLPGIDLDAALSALEFGDSLGLDPRRALGAWISAGGGLRIDDLDVVADSISAEAEGALALSADGKISGDLDVTITGLDALPGLVESFYPEARDQTEQIVTAVEAFTRPVETPSGPARQMTLLFRDSVVSIGILPIGVIPPIVF